MELLPKQKAEELVNKYIPHIAGADRYNSTLGIYDKEISKQCALIAQKNLLNKLKELNIVDEFEEEVLFEINAL